MPLSLRLPVLLFSALLGLTAGTGTVIAATDPAPDSRPRIGLALSGGGARGAAHISVLKALEQHGIPVDCIAGTSMGAVVGGLYASGLSANEIETIFRELDWSSGFRDKPARANLSWRRKQDDRGYLVNFDVGYRDGQFRLPRGLVKGQNLNLALRDLLQHSALETPFDQLPIPYRAVAADLETGAAVVLDRGMLAEAIQASMAIPGVYQPIERDGRLLVDGGVADNLPIKLVRELCADVVIAVDVSSPLLDRAQLGSVIDVVDQLSTMLTRRNSEASIATLRERDVLIRPDLSGIAGSDFSKIEDALSRGNAAANAAEARLLAVRDLSGFQAAVRTPSPVNAPRIQSISINNGSGLSTENILQRVQQPLGAPLDQARLHSDLELLYGTGYFGSLNYQLLGDAERADLQIDIPENPIGPHYFRFGVNIEDNFKGDSLYGIGARHTWMPANGRGGEWRNEVQFGSESRLFTEWFQPLSQDGNWFVGTSLEYGRWNILFQTDDARISQLQLEARQLALNGGYQFGTTGHVLLGTRFTSVDVREHIGSLGISQNDLDVGEGFVEFGIDKLDHRYFPRKGRAGSLVLARGAESLGAGEAYERWTFNWLQVASRGRHTLGAQAYFGSFVHDKGPLQEWFTLGGFLRLSGYAKNQLNGRHARLLDLIYLYRLDNDFSATLDTPVYVGTSLEWGGVWQNQRDINRRDLKRSASLFLGIDTTFGPLYFAYGRNSDAGDALYLFLGSPF